jgi:hypothetical protein
MDSNWLEKPDPRQQLRFVEPQAENPSNLRYINRLTARLDAISTFIEGAWTGKAACTGLKGHRPAGHPRRAARSLILMLSRKLLGPVQAAVARFFVVG